MSKLTSYMMSKKINNYTINETEKYKNYGNKK